MKSFFVIKIWNSRNGDKGFLVSCDEKTMGYVPHFCDKAMQFESYFEANTFIREKKVEKKGIKSYIIESTDLAKDPDSGAVKMDTDMFYIEKNGMKLCVNEKVYFLKNCDAGFCCWKKRDVCEKIIDTMPALNGAEIKILPKTE